MKKSNGNSEQTAFRLRKRLNELDMKQQQLADASGVSKNSISQYLSGRVIPSNISAGKMAKILGCSPVWLMGFPVSQNGEVMFSDENMKEELLTDDEYEFIALYRMLISENKATVKLILKSLVTYQQK